MDLASIQNLSEDDNPLDAKYKLSGVIEHFGSAHGGHYVAYRPLFTHQLHEKEEGDNTWIICDDNQVSYVKKRDILNRKAYMLIYERINSSGSLQTNERILYNSYA